jgi:hypothetical protein
MVSSDMDLFNVKSSPSLRKIVSSLKSIHSNSKQTDRVLRYLCRDISETRIRDAKKPLGFRQIILGITHIEAWRAGILEYNIKIVSIKL